MEIEIVKLKEKTEKFKNSLLKKGLFRIGIGTDIEDIERFTKLDFNKNLNFFKRVFTENEINYCLSKKNSYQHFAARFAGKEATIKAISSFCEMPVDYKNIEILRSNKYPYIGLKINGFDNFIAEISLSHSKNKAIAFVLIAK